MNQTLGYVERFLSEWQTYHWRFLDARGTLKGSAGQKIRDAVFGLFDLIVREPFREFERAEAEAKKPYLPPMTLDGVPFIFDRGDKIVFHDGNFRVNFKVRFPGEIFSLSDPTYAQLEYHDGTVFTIRECENEYWNADHSTATSFQTIHRLDDWMPLEIAVRWLYMHTVYLSLRPFRELGLFDHSIMRLIEAREGLCSVNTFRELCGFTPSCSDAWKIYVQDHERFVNGALVRPVEHFKLVYEGESKTISKKLTSVNETRRYEFEGVVVLNGSNRIVYSHPAQDVFSRYGEWHSTFGDGESYWRQPVWRAAATFEQKRQAFKRWNSRPTTPHLIQ